MLPCDPTKTTIRQTRVSSPAGTGRNKVIEMYGRVHSDICNMPKFIIPGVRIQIKFTKAKQDV